MIIGKLLGAIFLRAMGGHRLVCSAARMALAGVTASGAEETPAPRAEPVAAG